MELTGGVDETETLVPLLAETTAAAAAAATAAPDIPTRPRDECVGKASPPRWNGTWKCW